MPASLPARLALPRKLIERWRDDAGATYRTQFLKAIEALARSLV